MADKKEEKKEEKKAGQPEDEEKSQAPLLELAQLRFLLDLPTEDYSATEKKKVKQQILDFIKSKNMAPYYKYMCKTYSWKLDNKLHKTMDEVNQTTLKSLSDKLEDSKKNDGETEIRDAKLAIAEYQAEIGDKEKALSAYATAMEATVGTGSRIDLVFALIRLGLFWNDRKLLQKHVEDAQGLVDKGGDWERRNKLQVYRAVYFITKREFKQAAKLFLDSIATFNCYELIPFNTFIFYTVLTSLVSLDRVTLRKSVVAAPEILSVLGDIPHLGSFLSSLYKCRYSEFFFALSKITPAFKQDVYLAAHAGYFMREVRIVAYTQFLQSYRSVTVESMAVSFGVTKAFIDRELSRFISAGRLNCKIDKVGGRVETNRPDAKNTQYHATIKQGDLLLNRIQKLTKVISY